MKEELGSFALKICERFLGSCLGRGGKDKFFKENIS